ncbi:MAG: helix-turn-helix transcriptional regulator [Bacteroidota bacterium]
MIRTYAKQVSQPIAISRRETEVLHLIAEELTTKEIASQLYISYETANTHRKNLLEKMHVRNTAGLIRRAFEIGLMRIEQPMLAVA